METRIIKVGESQIDFFRDEDQTFLAVKPACKILAIDYSGQISAIKKNQFLAPTMEQCSTVAKDGKERDMIHLPQQEFIWWLLNIDANKVKADNRETLRNSQ